jgi:hypothetical protein
MAAAIQCRGHDGCLGGPARCRFRPGRACRPSWAAC